MRILHVIPFFTPDKGGSAQVAYQMARHLGERGHSVTVVASDHGAQNTRFPTGPFEVVLLPATIARFGFYVTAALPGWISRNISRFDVIHMHEMRTFQNAVVARVAVRQQVPYVLSPHGTLPVFFQRQAAKQAYDLLAGRAVLAAAKRLIAVSPAEEQQFVDHGVAPARITLIYNGLDLAEFSDLPARGVFRQKWAIPPDARLVLYLGRIHRIKGLDHLIAAFARLRVALPDAVLVVAGPDDGDLARLKEMAQDMGLAENLHFTGGLYNTDKLAAMVDADVFAAPSQYEIFGLAPFEALMCGSPVVVTAGSAAGQLLQQIGAGYLTPFGDADALAQVLVDALTDTAQSRQMVQTGQVFARERLGWPGIAQELEQLYAAETTAAQR